MKPTIHDIARLSGVSKSTVSYILNNKETPIKISQHTIRKVNTVMEELKYSPNETAVKLAKQNKKKVRTLVLSPWFNQANSWFMAEVFRAIRNMEKQVKCEYRMYIRGELNRILKKKNILQYDSILIMGTNKTDDNFFGLFNNKKDNIILLNRKLKNFIYVANDDYKGGELISKEVLKSRYYKNYVILMPPNSSQVIKARKSGINSYFKQKGVKKPHVTIIKEEHKHPLDEQFHSVLERYGKEKVLFFTFLDSFAVKFMNFIIKQNVKIPQEIGITGYDCESISPLMIHPITTVNTKIYEMAKTALEIIIKKYEGEEVMSKTFIPDIVAGESIQLKMAK